MQAMSRWRSLLNSRISAALSDTQSASFHSTAACNERSNKTWNHCHSLMYTGGVVDFCKYGTKTLSCEYLCNEVQEGRRPRANKNMKKQMKTIVRIVIRIFEVSISILQGFVRGQQRAVKNHIRFVTHEKRDDTRRALKNLLFNTGAFENPFQHEGRSRKKVDRKSCWNAESGYDPDGCTQKRRSKARSAERVKSKLKRKLRRGYLSEDDERREALFEAAFSNRSYSWNFTSFERSSFHNSKSGFEWTEDSYSRNYRNKKWEAASDIESDDHDEEVGSHNDRTILGLPPSGPLKMEDVKAAFRLSALKWHPDKHQGCSQAEAEEKFKLCVNAYKSLCNAISAA